MNPTVEDKLIYDSEEKVIYVYDNKIYLVKKGKKIQTLDFKQFIREIDIIPEKEPDWKRQTILKMAKKLGFFGL